MAYSGFTGAPSYGYTYDALGNIATYTENGTAYTYTYDDLGQLLTAAGGGKAYAYTYDLGGNILTASNGTTSHTYTYGDSQWVDLLTAFDGQAITYDASGNPLSYYNGSRYTFTWSEGRRLTSAAVNGKTYTYAYDSDGLRLSKTVDGVTHNYFYASGKLLRETYGNVTLDFLYNNNGYPYALNYTTGGTTTTYYYITNLQGDVLSLIDASGNSVASYTYDPYGKVLSATGTMAQTNPLRYRGYYYDSETGFYYLQSRYYDPTTCRFINADSFASTGQGILGHNMFAYCQNNPINYADYSGEFLIEITVTTAGTIAAITVIGIAIFYHGAMIIQSFLNWLSRRWYSRWASIRYIYEAKPPQVESKVEEPDVTYPGDDPAKAPDGYEWRGTGPQGSKEGGYANPNGKDSWHPDLDHPQGVNPHWDYNDGYGHKWRVFPDSIDRVY